jgi:hypothetical protein
MLRCRGIPRWRRDELLTLHCDPMLRALDRIVHRRCGERMKAAPIQ